MLALLVVAKVLTEMNELRKNSAMGSKAWRHGFGMPLYAEDESMSCAFDSFNDAGRRGGIDDQAFTQSLNGLVVRRINLKNFPSDDLLQAGTRPDLNRMPAQRSSLAQLMLAGIRQLGGNILVQRTAQRDVDELSPAANSQQRDVAFYRNKGEFQFKLSPVVFDLSEFFGGSFAVKTRVNVEIAAA